MKTSKEFFPASCFICFWFDFSFSLRVFGDAGIQMMVTVVFMTSCCTSVFFLLLSRHIFAWLVNFSFRSRTSYWSFSLAGDIGTRLFRYKYTKYEYVFSRRALNAIHVNASIVISSADLPSLICRKFSNRVAESFYFLHSLLWNLDTKKIFIRSERQHRRGAKPELANAC